MSFILDAIAKSERERQQQQIPDAGILAMPADENRQPRRVLPYLLLGALLLSVFVLLIWMQSGETLFGKLKPSDNTIIESAANDKAATADKEGAGEEMTTAKITASAVDVMQLDKIERVSPQTTTANALTPGPAALTTNRNMVDKPTAEIKVKSSARIDDVDDGSGKKPQPALSQDKLDNRDGDTQGVRTVEPGSTAVIDKTDSATQAVPHNETAPGERKVFRLGELPSNVRRDLPSVAFSGHLYSKNVKVSYVMVDGGRSVIAGQQIADELLLHKVTPTGAIVDFRGYLIEVGILQNWSLK